jgi:hypothetical protein
LRHRRGGGSAKERKVFQIMKLLLAFGNILIYCRNSKKRENHFWLHLHCELLELGTRKIEMMIKIIKAHHCACVVEGK